MKDKLFKWYKNEDIIVLPYDIFQSKHYAILYREQGSLAWTEGTIHKEDLEKFHQIDYNSEIDFQELIKNMFGWDWSLPPSFGI